MRIGASQTYEEGLISLTDGPFVGPDVGLD